MDIEINNPGKELERVIELTEVDLDYTGLKKYVEGLNRLTSNITSTDISFINLIDSYTQWTVSYSGLELHKTPPPKIGLPA